MKKMQMIALSAASVFATLETQAHAQERAWTLSGSYIIADASGKLYRHAAQNQKFQLMRVNKLSGQDTWTYETAKSFLVSPECSEKNHVYLTTDGKAVALDARSGKPVWTFDSNKSNDYFSMACIAGYKSLYFFDRRASGLISSIDKTTGRVRWSYSPKAPFDFIGKKAQNVYLSTFKNNRGTIISLSSGTGRVKWERKLNEDQAITVLASGEAFVSDNYSFTKLNPETGKDLWTYGEEGVDAFLISNPKSILYVGSNGKFRRLDPATGKAVWTNLLADYSQYQVLESGDILIRSEKAQGRTDFELWASDGEKIWDTAFPGEGYAREDQSGNLFYVARSELTSIDRKTGETKWTFARANPVPRENLRRVETYGKDVAVIYIADGSEDPPSGLLSLDAETGRLNWDVWENATISLVGAGPSQFFITRADGSASFAYRR